MSHPPAPQSAAKRAATATAKRRTHFSLMNADPLSLPPETTAPDSLDCVVSVARLGALLRARGWQLTTAESCTGGWLAKVLTDAPGASAWFVGGFVTYSDATKRVLLDVPATLLDTHGAVSTPVARAMAAGALRRAAAQLAVAVSGIAGPDGGTPHKPVGTVCFAWAWAAESAAAPTVRVQTLRFAGDRAAVRRQSVARAVAGLLAVAADVP